MYPQDPFPVWDDPSQPFELQGIMADFPQDGLAMAIDSEQPTSLELHLDELSQTRFAGGPSCPPFANPFSPSALQLEYPNQQQQQQQQQQQPPWRMFEDAWNPLLATTPTPQSMLPVSGNYAVYQQSAPSDSGHLYSSQCFPESDSAYETRFCSTSSMSSANLTETPCYSKGSRSVWSADSSQVQSQRTADSEVISCGYPNCPWKGKCPSDKKKHEARHRKEFRCDEPNCSRKEGFGTVNDLARHKKCVHKQNPNRCPKMVYKCFGPDCPRRDKEWPRLDNFKQHISRIHGATHIESLIKKSNEWYQKRARSESNDFAALNIQQQDPEDVKEFLDSCSTATPGQISTSSEFFQSPESMDAGHGYTDLMSAIGSSPAMQNLQNLSSAQLPTFNTLGFQQRSDTPKGNAEKLVAEVAENVSDAVGRIMNSSNQRRMSHQTDEGIDITDPQSDVRNQLLQKIFSATWERVSSGTGSPQTASDIIKIEGDNDGWYKCNHCSKRTRRQCEMKKHQKRHERPYGCTFCSKTFGSKADWKRHERSQHDHQQSTPVDNAIKIDQSGCTESLQFWCGFCRGHLPLESTTIDKAWNERFNHIDEEHFKTGQRIDEWQSEGPVEKQEPEADYSGNPYVKSPALEDTTNILKRKTETTSSGASSPSESKKRQTEMNSPSGLIPETVSCCQCQNGLGGMAKCLFEQHDHGLCDGCHGMEFSGSGCAWSNFA